MNPFARFLPRLTSEERVVFIRQLMVLFMIITLLNLGFYWLRTFRERASTRSWQSVIQGWDGLVWYVWMPAAPLTLLLIRRHPFERERPVRSAVRLLAGSAAIYCVITNARFLLRVLPNLWLPASADRPVTWTMYADTQMERIPLDFLTYCGLFAAAYAVDYYSKYHQRAEELLRLQLRAAQLQSELAGFQLTALRGQLHPHFLFNSFNAISTLVRQRQSEAAVETIAQLGELLRFVMEKFDQHELPLEQELNFIRCYLNVERVRFGEKLRVVFAASPETLGCIVPSLLLQPLVENAIKHGIACRLAPGEVCVRAQRRQNRLLVEVTNDGPEEGGSPPGSGQPRSGIGLSNTRRRLDHVYGTGYRFDVMSRPQGGTAVRLDLPWRDAPTLLQPEMLPA